MKRNFLNFFRFLFGKSQVEQVAPVELQTPIEEKSPIVVIDLVKPVDETVVVSGDSVVATSTEPPKPPKKRKPRQRKPKVVLPDSEGLAVTKPNRNRAKGNQIDNQRNTFKSKKK